MPLPWRRALVVGASSGIGAAIARRLAQEGARIALVARRADELTRVAGEIEARGAGTAVVRVHDVRRPETVPALFRDVCDALGGLDLVVYAAGVMPHIREDQYDLEADRATVDVNLLGAIAWLNEAALRFAAAGGGTIIGISSVAGDRGRRGNPAYSASKAGLTTYLEALRNRLARRGVVVVTAKPGPVDTPMSAGRDRLPFLISASEAARLILAGAARGAATVYVPARWRPIMAILRAIPSRIFRRLDV